MTSPDNAETNTDFIGGGAVGRLLQLIGERPVLAAIGVLLSIVSALLAFAPHATVFAIYLNATQTALQNTSPVHIAVLGCAAVALRWFCILLTMGVSHILAFGAQRRLRQRMADRMLKAPMYQLLERSSGDIRATVISDVESLEDGLAHLLPDVVGNSIGLLAVFAALAYVDLRLAIAAVFSIFVGFLFMAALTRDSSKGIKSYFESKAETQAITTEYVKGLPVLRIFNAGESASQRINDVIERLKVSTKTFAIQSSIPHTAFLVFITSNVLFLAPVGYALYLSGAVSATDLVFVLIFSIGFGDACLTFLLGLVRRFGSLGGVLARIDDLLNLSQLPAPTRPQKPAGSDIVFENVSFRYDEQPVLDNVSFSIAPGERIALVGPSGGGKSTMARLIPRFMDVDAGAVKVGGADVRQIPDADLGDVVSFVFQEVFLFSDTIRQNIAIGRPDASFEEIENAARRAEAHSFIMDLPEGYDTRLREGGEGLSVGQKQRLSIARAILKDAPILILDEATAYADPENEARVRAALTSLSKGKTVLMIAHRLRSITDVDRILVLKDGQVIEQGPHQDLLSKGGLYRELWDSQQSEAAA